MDTTMRDGEQSPGVVFSKSDKINLLKMLTAIGIKEAEVGTPAMGVDEMNVISTLVAKNLPITLFSWNRALIKDIANSISCGINHLFISTPVSDLQIQSKLGKSRDWVIHNLKESIDYAKNRNCFVALGLEDSSRADISWLISLIKETEKAGADRIRISDTVGIFTPESVYQLIKRIKLETDIPLEIHTHNDFGLATANSLSAFSAGADYIDTTLMGIGERAGNASMEEIALALKVLYDTDSGIALNKIKQVAKIFSHMIKEPINKWKPVTGQNVFCHESGIHVDGILKNPVNYEPYPPEITGTKREFIIGKHSGRKAIEYKFAEMGLILIGDELDQISSAIKKLALQKKFSMTDIELLQIYSSIRVKQDIILPLPETGRFGSEITSRGGERTSSEYQRLCGNVADCPSR